MQAVYLSNQLTTFDASAMDLNTSTSLLIALAETANSMTASITEFAILSGTALLFEVCGGFDDHRWYATSFCWQIMAAAVEG